MNNHTIKKTVGQRRGKAADSRLRYLTISGVMAALITVMTAYIAHVPVGVNGTYIHFGDALIYLAAAILPTPYALAAAAIGAGLADLLTAPVWAPATVVIKMLVALLFTGRAERIITVRNVIVLLPAYLVTGLGYFAAEYLMFGSAASAFVLSMGSNLIQSAGSAAVFVILGLALDRIGLKKRL